MRLMRFRCSSCGLEMALGERPERCFSCGSIEIVREGWRMLVKTKSDERSQKECGQE
jgi:DNA-directed RNA polymerase subunit N (RpoN/RPB10)